MKKRNKWFAMLMIVCMLVMMFGAVAQANDDTYNGYKISLTATCTRTLATVKLTYAGNSAIYACGTVRYTSKYNTGTSGTVYTIDISQGGIRNVTAKYTPNSAYYNVNVNAWGMVENAIVIGGVSAAAGLVR